ncbi:hypothetical protein ENSA5_55180 [Enhygromyxa salina]|uniref:DUF4136 domain-containing protein n=1 Tax=Enhygromyxa salina TaxID=215803 RepID=A0A2S9XFF5_9BACT|nr:DUF4136 domain-containing protein [Enhygromyxa salina]PRP91401.1 hypothetical protein ENSA5_55180 [Enhygromyxa salina]
MLRPRALLRVVPLALLLTAPLAGCSQQLSAETEYAKDQDFSQYQTYRWLTDDLVLIQSGTGNEKIRNLENEKRIRAAVERELEAKGLKKAEGEAAELVIAFTVGTKVRYQIQGGTTALDMATADPATVTRGMLTLYFFDSERETQVWSAWTKKDLEPGADPDEVINAAVSVLMDEFPPA